jgi:hypothetical protein
MYVSNKMKMTSFTSRLFCYRDVTVLLGGLGYLEIRWDCPLWAIGYSVRADAH